MDDARETVRGPYLDPEKIVDRFTPTASLQMKCPGVSYGAHLRLVKRW